MHPIFLPHEATQSAVMPQYVVCLSVRLSGTSKATDFRFDRHIHRVHPIKSPLKISDKREHGRIQGLPKFLSTPYYLRNG